MRQAPANSWRCRFHWVLPLGLAAAALSPGGEALGMCDVIPGVTQDFRGALGSGGTCATLFDFSDRLYPRPPDPPDPDFGVGPVLIARSEDRLRLDAQSPVPLDGLIESDQLFAFVANEAIGEPQDDCDGDGLLDCNRLNDDPDGNDPVLRLRDRVSGASLSIGTHGAEGRAVTRVRQDRFRFPAVAVEDDLVAFLELEPLEGDCSPSAATRIATGAPRVESTSAGPNGAAYAR